MRQLESMEQQRLFTWWRLEGCKTYGLPPCVLFAIPNGGKRSLKTAMQLKREGVQPGVPDIFLAVPARHHYGLFVELKRPKGPGVSAGRPTQAQREVMASLMARGYCCRVAYGFTEARQVIERYLGKEA